MTLRPLISVAGLVLLALTLLALVLFGYFRADRNSGYPGAPVAWFRRALLAALVVFSLAGPSVKEPSEQKSSNVEIVFAVDRTGSMAAEDGPGGAPRFDAVRDDVETIVKETGGSRYAVLTWDSTSRIELPFTTDSSAVLSFAETLHQEVTAYSKGSSLDRPVSELVDLLESARTQRPENIRYLVLLTDGEPSGEGANQQGVSAFESVQPLIDGGGVVGYGTEDGGVMRIYQPGQGWDPETPPSEYMTDPSAAPGGPVNDRGESLAVSRIDLASLEELSDVLAIPLLVNPDEARVKSFARDLMKDAKEFPGRAGERYTYQYVLWAPALAMLPLLAWEVGSDARALARLRKSRAI